MDVDRERTRQGQYLSGKKSPVSNDHEQISLKGLEPFLKSVFLQVRGLENGNAFTQGRFFDGGSGYLHAAPAGFIRLRHAGAYLVLRAEQGLEVNRGEIITAEEDNVHSDLYFVVRTSYFGMFDVRSTKDERRLWIHIDRHDRIFLFGKIFQDLLNKRQYTLDRTAFQQDCKAVFVPQLRVNIRVGVGGPPPWRPGPFRGARTILWPVRKQSLR